MALHALRDLAEGSPQVRAATRLQAMADRHTAGAVQRKTEASGSGAGRPLPSPGPEQALHPDIRATMEGALGMDFASVRLHEGPRASAMGALAYTQGSHIHFAPGRYQPDTRPGRELLGHELAHVVQQTRGRVQATGQIEGVPSNDDPALEREADALGRKAAHGWTSATGHRSSSGLGETSALSSSPSPVSQSMPVQRVVNPTLHRHLGAIHPGVTPLQAQKLYNDALQYLWTSPSARAIYEFIHADPTPVEVRVGAPQSFTSAKYHNITQDLTNWLVEWDPFEIGVLTDTDIRTIAPNVGYGGVQLHGTMSTATLLLHEMGHVKQNMEAREFETSFAGRQPGILPGTGQIARPKSDVGDWLIALHNAILALYPNNPPTLVQSTMPVNQAPGNVNRDVVEPDNVTRHERPVAREKNETLRMNYHTTLTPQLLTPQQQLQLGPLNAAFGRHVTQSLALGGPAPRPVHNTILSHLQNLMQIVMNGKADLQGEMASGIFVKFPGPAWMRATKLTHFNNLIPYIAAAQVYFARAAFNQGIARNVPARATPTFHNP